jgi:putative FmdB family regulatory protein
MPIYEYVCGECKSVHEIMQKITDNPLTVCPACGGSMKKKISNTSFVLKGTGWYATDYASNKSTTSAPKAEKTEGADTKKTETKAETKTAKQEAAAAK